MSNSLNDVLNTLTRAKRGYYDTGVISLSRRQYKEVIEEIRALDTEVSNDVINTLKDGAVYYEAGRGSLNNHHWKKAMNSLKELAERLNKKYKSGQQIELF